MECIHLARQIGEVGFISRLRERTARRRDGRRKAVWMIHPRRHCMARIVVSSWMGSRPVVSRRAAAGGAGEERGCCTTVVFGPWWKRPRGWWGSTLEIALSTLKLQSHGELLHLPAQSLDLKAVLGGARWFRQALACLQPRGAIDTAGIFPCRLNLVGRAQSICHVKPIDGLLAGRGPSRISRRQESRQRPRLDSSSPARHCSTLHMGREMV